MVDKTEELRELIDDAIKVIEDLQEEKRELIMIQNFYAFRNNIKDVIKSYDKHEDSKDQEWFQSLNLYDEFDVLVSKTRKIKDGEDKW